jgi:formate hydrogenlyase subunit 4
MFLLLARLLATLLHIALVFALAPLLAGGVARLRARLLGRRGAPVTQPYRLLLRLLRKTTLVPDTSTELYKVWPFAAFAAMACVAMLVPGFTTGMLTAPLADFITIIGLLSLSRAATLLGGLETGFGFGGAGAARELLFSVFAEAALLVVLITFVLIADTFNINTIVTVFATGHVGISISLGFALVAMLAVALTETGRIPVDNPAGHLEVAMVHEALLLEYSGRFLWLFEYAAMLRLMVWMNLIASVFFPFFMARAGNPLTWPVGLALWGAKLAVMAVALPVFEVSMAKMRVFRVPEFLGVAILLGVLAGVFLFVAARIGA